MGVLHNVHDATTLRTCGSGDSNDLDIAAIPAFEMGAANPPGQPRLLAMNDLEPWFVRSGASPGKFPGFGRRQIVEVQRIMRQLSNHSGSITLVLVQELVKSGHHAPLDAEVLWPGSSQESCLDVGIVCARRNNVVGDVLSNL